MFYYFVQSTVTVQLEGPRCECVCQYVCVSDQMPLQGVPHPSPNACWDRLQFSTTLNRFATLMPKWQVTLMQPRR